MEKIILGGIEKHLEDNAVISHSNHGFMRGKSCLLNLTSFYNRATHPADQGKPGDVMFLDFSRTLDTVSHRILLDKMSSTQLDKHIMGRDSEDTKFNDDTKLGGAVDFLMSKEVLQRP
ncbi:hypothetical protein HGM15179_009005 [Zosterops borbonicus]|uniref:Rna-directed dna polymerase from mobile element jockey-like n=1 Tax=Zosterops borbonicus TaxID=364589 RepID=A0A8K1GHB5_9PASS|nr:hypothetical protein HGM15179_009005 [Zosterops borbonicus]